MNRMRPASALCLAALAACHSPDAEARDAQAGFPDAEAYSAVLREAARGYDVPVLFVGHETMLGPERFAPTPETFDQMHGTALAGVEPETLRSFRARNATTHAIPANLDPRRPYELLPMDVWGPDEQRRPVFVLTRPGYSAGRTQALVYAITACPLCDGAFFYLLHHDGEHWTVVRSSGQWYS